MEDNNEAMENAAGVITTSVVAAQSPDLLLSEVDRRITRIRPMSTPIDQISRHARSRRAGSMTVDYYSVNTKPFETKLTAAVSPSAPREEGEPFTIKVQTERNAIFSPSDTVLFPSLAAPAGDGMVTAYVTAADEGMVEIVSTTVDANGNPYFPATIPSGTKIVRMGRAARELDVQTPNFQALPQKRTNFCQIFKAQVEQSTLVKLSNKEASWSLSDQEEAALIDMRQGMERNFLFGNAMRLHPNGTDEEVMLTRGIWNQTDNTYRYDVIDPGNMTAICRQAFTGSTGSSRKLLVGGTGFIEKLHSLEATRTLGAADKVTKWGLDFTEYVSKFGTLYILASETFDQCGHENDAMVIDPEYLTKYTHIPMQTETLDLRSSGQRNTDAVVITEASCLVLRYPDAHLRIICEA